MDKMLNPSVAASYWQMDPEREYFDRDRDDDRWWLRMREWRRQKDKGNKISEDDVKNVAKDEKFTSAYKAEVKDMEAWRQIKIPEIILSCEYHFEEPYWKSHIGRALSRCQGSMTYTQLFL